MKNTLVFANIYLKDPQARRRMIAENAWESSVYEGAHGLKLLDLQPIADLNRTVMASVKKLSSEE